MDNLVYAKVGPEAELIADSVADHIRQKLDAKGENRLLLDNGEYIADYRGTEYYVKQAGRWCKEKIDSIGIALDHGEIPVSEITPEIQAEISAQQETERIAGLTLEKKTEEKNNRLRALAREAVMKAEESELLGEAFDRHAWFQVKKS